MLEDYLNFGGRLAPDACIVKYSNFENAILKVQENCVGILKFEEKAEIRGIQKHTNSTTQEAGATLTIVKRAAKRTRLDDSGQCSE